MSTKDRIQFIEILRGIGVLSVVINHFFHDLLPSGYLGVDVFFVVSGFVISKYLLENSFDSPSQLFIVFFYKRLKRLMPLMYLTILASLLLVLTFMMRPSDAILKSASMPFLGISNIFYYISSQNYFSLNALTNPFTHTWSLGLEEQFYQLFPLSLYFLGFISITGRQKPDPKFSILGIVFFIYHHQGAIL